MPKQHTQLAALDRLPDAELRHGPADLRRERPRTSLQRDGRHPHERGRQTRPARFSRLRRHGGHPGLRRHAGHRHRQDRRSVPWRSREDRRLSRLARPGPQRHAASRSTAAPRSSPEADCRHHRLADQPVQPASSRPTSSRPAFAPSTG